MKISSDNVLLVSQVVDSHSTRPNGALARELAKSVISEVGSVKIDLNGARITPSFADEFFGKLCCELGFEAFKRCVALINFDEQDRSLIRHVVLQRAAEPVSEHVA